MPCYKLTYFNLRGAVETARVIMAYGGIEYEDVRIPYPPTEEWAKIKPTTPFGQIPVLEVDGVQISQSHAISRFLAKKVGLHGRSDIEEAKVDMAVGCFADIYTPLVALFLEKDEAKKAVLKKSCQQSLNDGLNKFEKLIEGNYILGKQLSWADIGVSEQMGFITSVLDLNVSLDKLPKLAGLINRVKAEPRIAAWIAKRPETPM